MTRITCLFPLLGVVHLYVFMCRTFLSCHDCTIGNLCFSLGEWSRAGCQTEVPEDWHVSVTKPFLVNCTCNHLSTFAVLVDLVDMQVSNQIKND